MEHQPTGMNDPNLQTSAQLLNNNLQHDHTICGSTSATTSGGCSELEQMIAAASIGKRSETVVTNKRKKSKPKSHGQHAAAPPNSARPPELDHQAVQKHLDDWLDNCLKDAPLTSSSSEFLDTQFPAQPSHHASTSSLKRGSGHGATASAAANAAAAAAAAAAQMYGPAGGAKMFGGGAGPKPSETPTRAMHDPFHNYQKYFPMYPPMGGGQPNFGSGITLNGAAPHGMSNSNYMNGSRQSNMNSDFSSLPPAVNMMNRGKDLRIDAQDILDGLEHRHFSDPCLAGASDDSKDSGNGPTTTTHRSPNSPKNESTKMLSTILEQIGALHDTNTKICRSLHENKVDIEALKHAPNWGLRHRRDSISGLSTHSQPLGYAAFGTHSPAPTFHSGMYTPGMLTDVVREVKEAARVREDALLNRVKALVEERSWMQSDSNAKLMREVEELKSQIGQLKSDRKETHSRFGKMEDELKSLRTLLTHVLHSQNVGAYHHPAVGGNMPQFHQHQPQQQLPMGHQQQHQLQQQQRPHRSSLSLSYGTINNNHDDTDLQAYVAGDEDATGDGGPLLTNGTKYGGHKATDGGAPLMDDRIAQIVRDNMDLRSDLSSALESRKMAESKITSLENMVMKLQSSITHGEPHHLQQQQQQHHHNNNNNSNNTSLGGSSNVGQQQQQQQQQMRSCSRNSSFSEGPAHTSSSSSTVVGVKTSGSGNLQHHHHSTPNASKSGHNNGGGTTISVVGPVTDL